jgi:hypothetical protein
VLPATIGPEREISLPRLIPFPTKHNESGWFVVELPEIVKLYCLLPRNQNNDEEAALDVAAEPNPIEVTMTLLLPYCEQPSGISHSKNPVLSTTEFTPGRAVVI